MGRTLIPFSNRQPKRRYCKVNEIMKYKKIRTVQSQLLLKWLKIVEINQICDSRLKSWPHFIRHTFYKYQAWCEYLQHTDFLPQWHTQQWSQQHAKWGFPNRPQRPSGSKHTHDLSPNYFHPEAHVRSLVVFIVFMPACNAFLCEE